MQNTLARNNNDILISLFQTTVSVSTPNSTKRYSFSSKEEARKEYKKQQKLYQIPIKRGLGFRYNSL